MSILLNKPLTPNLTKLMSYLERVNNNNWYTNFGPLHNELTEKLEDYLDVQNLLLVSNGTLAIQVACKTLNVSSAFTTPFSFVATASSLLWQNIEIDFSDIDLNNFNLCPARLDDAFKKKPHYDAVVATHVYGNPCSVERLNYITKKHNKKIIYDAAHAFGVKIGEKSLLNYGDASTLSFHATKIFHTIEGGAIVFKDNNDFLKAKELINFGINSSGHISNIGINAKLNEYQCAVGLVLLEQIDSVLEHRKMLFDMYRSSLDSVVYMPKWYENANFNGAYMPIYFFNVLQSIEVEKKLNENGIQCRRYFDKSLDVVFASKAETECCNSKKVAESILCLPLHFYMTPNDVKKVVKIIKQVIK